jgi:hypothetical protein
METPKPPHLLQTQEKNCPPYPNFTKDEKALNLPDFVSNLALKGHALHIHSNLLPLSPSLLQFSTI